MNESLLPEKDVSQEPTSSSEMVKKKALTHLKFVFHNLADGSGNLIRRVNNNHVFFFMYENA